MTKKGRPASVKKQWAAKRETGRVGKGAGEGDGGAGLMIRKLQRLQVRARGNKGTSGTGSIHSVVVICAQSRNIYSYFGWYSVLKGLFEQIFFRKDHTSVFFFVLACSTNHECVLLYCRTFSKAHHVFLDRSLLLQATTGFDSFSEWLWGRILEAQITQKDF